jgi:hypothetical protein
MEQGGILFHSGNKDFTRNKNWSSRHSPGPAAGCIAERMQNYRSI